MGTGVGANGRRLVSIGNLGANAGGDTSGAVYVIGINVTLGLGAAFGGEYGCEISVFLSKCDSAVLFL